jgi:phosphatidylglycerol:prolipoprotein diacylglycerol transferase
MYPKISDLINSLLGTNINLPVQSYGFMVAMAFLVAGFFVMLELKRKEKEGLLQPIRKKIIKGKPASINEIIISAIISFFIGLKVTGIFANYSFFANNPQDYIMSWDGSFIGGLLFGAVSGYWTYRSKEKEKLPQPVTEEITFHPYQLTANIVFIAAVAGIAGAKLFDVIEHLDDLFRDPIGTLFSFSGLAFYGGLIVAAVSVIVYARKNGISFQNISDSAAPALMIAYAVGRMGCQISGDGCWGVPNLNPKPEWLGFLPDWAWAFSYPHNVINEGVPIADCAGSHCFVLDQPVYPTPLYETMLAGFFFLVLWNIRKRITIPGVLFGIYLMFNGIERFLVEKIRVNIKYDLIAGIKATQAEIISTGLFLTGFTIICWFIFQHKKNFIKR